MGGWRDVEGRTTSERKTRQRAADAAALVEAVRRRPLSLVKPVVGFVLILTLCVAILLIMR
jgi:hypothetical protein